jgi:pyruvate formate lyase activating enzyme
VLFTGGCNFRCPFCHNGSLVLDPHGLADIPLDHILERLNKFRKWVERVVITGGEPTIHKALTDLTRVLKSQGFKIKVDTNGTNPEVLKELVSESLVDYIAMDIKGPLNDYDRWAGVSVTDGHIRQTIDLILEGHVDYEFRMTVVPFLHKEHDVYAAAEEIRGAKRFFLQEFVPKDTLNPKFAGITPFSAEKMKAMRESVRSIIERNAPVSNNLY